MVIVRTTTGKELTITPNHPILTTKGWIAAGLLKEGDQIIEYLPRKNPFPVKPNDVDIVPTIEDVAHSLGEAFKLGTMKVMGSSKDFHGD